MSAVSSLGSLIVAAAALLTSIIVNFRKSNKDDFSQIAMMLTKLDMIQDDIKDMKNNLSDMRQDIQDNHDRVLKIEMSLETAWKRIDELRGVKRGE